LGTESEMILTCRQCGKRFLFTESEQQFYQQKGFTLPGHCPECRSIRRVNNVILCSKCGKKILKASEVHCDSCLETVRLELEIEVRRLNTALQEASARLEVAESEKAQLTEPINARLAAIESEKSQLVREAEAKLSSLETEYNRRCQEMENNLRAAESEKACLASWQEREKQLTADLQEKLSQANIELEKANCYRATIDYLEPTLKGIRATLEGLQHAQDDLNQAILQTVHHLEDGTPNVSVLDIFKRFFRIGRKSASPVN
jgi:chromosome segregation ATPase